MHYRFLALLLVSQLALAARVSADNVDRRVDRAGEAAVAAELDGQPTRPKERARRQPGPADQPPREQARPRRGKPISLGLLLGYGIELDDLGVNPWGIGFGARGGYNAGPLFLGGRFVFYLGEDPSNIWELGLEGGYDVKSGVVTVRPGLGFGLANLVVDAPGVDSTTDAYLAPGLSLLLDVSRDIFVGVEGRVQFILAEPDGFEAIIVLGNLGMRF
jgi:hypothetical protein